MGALNLSKKEVWQYYLDSITNDDFIEDIERFINEKNYGYKMTDKKLDFYINLFLYLKRNYITSDNEEINLDEVIYWDLKKTLKGINIF